MSTEKPLVSVIMPMRNAAPFVEEAVGSILSQTWRNLELLVFDDGSTDGGGEIVSAISDARIRLLGTPEHAGIVSALNVCLDAARGTYIARMDADDISHRDRLDKQVRLLDAHPDIGACGTWMTSFGTGMPNLYVFPVRHEEIVCDLLFNPSLIHGTVMFRSKLARDADIHWRDDHRHAEDYEWLIRLARITRVANIPEDLYSYRMHPGQTGSAHAVEQREVVARIQRELVLRLVPDASDGEFARHDALARWEIPRAPAALALLHEWLQRLLAANDIRRIYDTTAMELTLAMRFFRVCDYFTVDGPAMWSRFCTYPLHRRAHAGVGQRASQFARALAGRDVPGRVIPENPGWLS